MNPLIVFKLLFQFSYLSKLQICLGDLFKNKKAKITWEFEEVDSIERAVELHKLGVLDFIYCMPLEFGGLEEPNNILYVPESVKAQNLFMMKSLLNWQNREKGLNINWKQIIRGEVLFHLKLIFK